MTPTQIFPRVVQPRQRPFRSLARVLFVTSILAQPTAWAQSLFEEDFDDPYKPWQEIAVQLPTAPSTENLLPFYVSPTATHDFMVDAKSLSVGSDGVVRYTLVTTSHSGVRNVSYEGIRCSTTEKKQYAFGQADGSWSRARRDQWQPIIAKGANRHHAALARDYFCDVGTIAGSADQILYRLRYKQALSPLTAPERMR